MIDVEVSYEISQARIMNRWKRAYEAALDGRDEWGGRWVPSEFARAVFDGPAGRSKPETVAAQLVETCPAVSRYRVYRTTKDATATSPAVGSWDKDLVRQEPGGPLLPRGAVSP